MAVHLPDGAHFMSAEVLRIGKGSTYLGCMQAIMRILFYLLLCIVQVGVTLNASAQFRCMVVGADAEAWNGPTTPSSSAANRGQDITIPVVMHVIWHTAVENVPESALLQQLEVLSTFTDTVMFMDTWLGNTHMFHANTGGMDPWDQEHYLNVYVVNRSYFLGTASSPSSHGNANDGVAIDYPEAAGATRSLTHEVGHYFGLRHVFGGTFGEQSCGNDGVDDTPLQTFHYNCPTYPFYSCGNTTIGDLSMNYMDYSPSSCKNMFTQGQVDLMNAQFLQFRSSFLEVNGCSYVGAEELAAATEAPRLAPNPANGTVQIWFPIQPSATTIRLLDTAGRECLIHDVANRQASASINISTLHAGVYIVQILDEHIVLGQQRLVVH